MLPAFAVYRNAIIEFDGAKVALFHGEDGYSNTRLERICYKVFKVSINNIAMVLAGHVHKYEIKKFDDTYAIHVPALQSRSNWMMSKKLTADCGYLILEFDVIEKHIYNLKVQYYNL